jgi:hypothetical protein
VVDSSRPLHKIVDHALLAHLVELHGELVILVAASSRNGSSWISTAFGDDASSNAADTFPASLFAVTTVAF